MLTVEYVDINTLVPYKNNAKLHPQEQVEQIKKSIVISRHIAPSRHNRRQAVSFMVLALDLFPPGPGEISDGIVRKRFLFAGSATGR